MQFLRNSLGTASAVAIVSLLRIASASGCNPTGAGVCNFGINVQAVCGDCPDEYQGTIYDRNCHVIGGNNEVIHTGEAIDSQLKYTVVVTELSYPNMAFCYAGSCYSDFQCSAADGGGANCARAFNC